MCQPYSDGVIGIAGALELATLGGLAADALAKLALDCRPGAAALALGIVLISERPIIVVGHKAIAVGGRILPAAADESRPNLLRRQCPDRLRLRLGAAA